MGTSRVRGNSEAVYEKLARDLLSRGRVEEAQQIEQKRKAAFIDEDNDRPPNGAITIVDLVTEGFTRNDSLVTESPLQLVINNRRFAVLMRTPDTALDSDRHLVLGFMFSEGIIDDVDDVLSIGYCVDPGNVNRHNTMRVQLHDGGGLNERLGTVNAQRQ